MKGAKFPAGWVGSNSFQIVSLGELHYHAGFDFLDHVAFGIVGVDGEAEAVLAGGMGDDAHFRGGDAGRGDLRFLVATQVVHARHGAVHPGDAAGSAGRGL